MGVAGFEGFEKRLEVGFFTPSVFVDPGGRGLRNVTRDELSELLSAAQCTIVSQLSTDIFDSYVLSESSLFVYPYKVILKTCGTTKLLAAIPFLLDHAARLSLKVFLCKYSRGAFLFPQEQRYPHGSFTEEVSFLNQYFGNLGSGSKAYILGDPSRTHTWHIYSACAAENGTVLLPEPLYTLEMCMTQLDRDCASKFYRSFCSTASEMSSRSGISDLLPSSRICDYSFDPCGYSMNGVDGAAFSTIHVTPEEGFSYASFEAMGYGSEDVDLPTLVEDVLACFHPAVFSMALHGKDVGKAVVGSWESPFVPRGYLCDGSSRQSLPGGCVTVFHTFSACKRNDIEFHPLPLYQWATHEERVKQNDEPLRVKFSTYAKQE